MTNYVVEQEGEILGSICVCKTARHLYAKYGFTMTDTKPNDVWADCHMTEELWEHTAQ